MSEISEFMDKTKSQIIFDEYKDINEKIHICTIKKLLGIVCEDNM